MSQNNHDNETENDGMIILCYHSGIQYVDTVETILVGTPTTIAAAPEAHAVIIGISTSRCRYHDRHLELSVL